MTGNHRLEQCFLPLNRRTPTLPCFFRVIGLDTKGDTLSFLRKFYQQTRTGGVYLPHGLSNPSEAEIRQLFHAVGETFVLSHALIVRHMTLWLGQVRPAQREVLAKAVWEALEDLRTQGANENIIKNAYVKFQCWLRTPLGHVLMELGQPVPPKLLFEGEINKYEFLLLHLLHAAGCDVVYVHFTSADSYQKADPNGKFSESFSGALLAPPAVHFTLEETPKQPPSAPPTHTPQPHAARPQTEPERILELNTWTGGRPMWEAILLPNTQRVGGASDKLCSLFAACFGADERGAYRNRLFQLKRDLDASGKKWFLFDRALPAPSADEAAPFRNIEKNLPREALLRNLAGQLTLNCSRVPIHIIQRAFFAVMDANPERDPVRSFNYGVRLACWIRRYGEALFDGCPAQHQPALVFYGPVKDAELSLLWVLAQMGTDVLYFSPDPAIRSVFSAHFLPHLWAEVLFDGTLPTEPFPQREERIRASTTAYNASRELDKLLYSDTGMFRDRQFARSQSVTLKTTYDEVGQLWKEQAQFRPSFDAKDGVVYVPNLLAKVCGVDQGDVVRYWNGIRGMITENTYLVDKLPFLPSRSSAMRVTQAEQFLHEGKLDPNALKASPFYQYDYLPDDTQDYILEKIQALMDYDLIVDGGTERDASMLSVLMNLDKELLQLLQTFDFPRDIPKFLVVDLTEAIFTLEECILLAFLNLVGFDIVVFTPTGYRNMEKYLRPDSFDTLTAGEYRFDLTMPNLREQRTNRGGDWLSRLFSGRNG